MEPQVDCQHELEPGDNGSVLCRKCGRVGQLRDGLVEWRTEEASGDQRRPVQMKQPLVQVLLGMGVVDGVENMPVTAIECDPDLNNIDDCVRLAAAGIDGIGRWLGVMVGHFDADFAKAHKQLCSLLEQMRKFGS